jgi:hypothetical protein
MPRCRAILVCDDLRQEVGNKWSAVGMYNDMIGFPAGQGPVGLPKLAVMFVVAGLAGTDELRFRYTMSFTPSAAPMMPAIPPLQVVRRPQPEIDEHNFMFQMMPAVFPGAGTLQIALELEVEEGDLQRFEHRIRVVRGAPGAAAVALPGTIETPN